MSLFKSKKTEFEKKAEIPTQDELNSVDIVVHAMPERFRTHVNPENKAKNTGILVLIFGVIFLGVMGFLFYYYVFKTEPVAKEATVAKETTQKATEKKAETPVKPVDETKKEEPIKEEVVPEPGPAEFIIEQATSTATSTQETPEIPVIIVKYQLAPDSDSDGLSDSEEAILGSDPRVSDSDLDGYDDIAETLNLYNPAGEGKLVDNPAFDTFTNTTFSYQLIKPSSWKFSKFGGDDSVMFEAVNSQFIQVIVQPNPNKIDINTWYQNQFEETVVPAEQMISKATWDGIYSKDGLTLYLTEKDSEHIITIAYNIGSTDRLFYKNIFKILVNSFVIN